MASDLLYLEEHVSCRHYVADYRCSFNYRDIKFGDKVDFDKRHNYLVFLHEGEVLVTCNEFTNRRFTTGDIFFIPKSAATEFTATGNSKLMVCVFDTVKNVCDKFSLTSYWTICKTMKYDFRPVSIVPQFDVFLKQLNYYLEQGVKCEHFHELKQQEMFLLFRWFYPREQLALLFYPIIGKSLDFKGYVLENYMRVRNINELVQESRMGRSSFDVMFKAEFGMSPGQWLLKQKAKHIKFAMSTPGVNISDIMIKFEFNSATHLTRFCKQQFGCTPSELMATLHKKAS
jgi:AraC-like DNA-binding protein